MRRARWLRRLEADRAFRERERQRLARKVAEHPANDFVARQLAEVETTIGEAAAARRRVRRERAAA
jgi:hypothetical protein